MHTMLVPLKRLLLVLGLVLSIQTPARAQSTERHVAFVQPPPSAMTVFPPRHELLFVSPVFSHRSDFDNGRGFRITANYRHLNLDSLSPLQETKTLFETQSRLPVAQVWGGRLQVNLFMGTLRTRNFVLGPLSPNDASQRARQLSSASLYGVGVSLPLGRSAGWEGSKGLWRSLQRIVRGE